ncbi:MAG TPA: peptidyl-prolyl cis-trans isomerase [Pyrinomonadaceae bacterium]|nr:peptidyl-prolyl cis-trans isomerase [Pyrinomonadaceae bacterium]
MLKQLGKLERTRNIVILGFAVLMAVSLIFFYAPGRTASNLDPSRNTEVVAKVGSQTITVADLARVKENYMRLTGGRMFGQFGNRQFLDGLISKYVIMQEAERLGLAASNAEVAEKIRAQYKNASGELDVEKYKQSITAEYGDVEKFENDTRADISQQKLRAFLSASVNVSDEEVEEEFRRRNSSFNVSYISLTTDKLAAKIQPSDEELRSYFESHKTDYRFLEPQKKVRYLFINTDKAGSKLQISDADLKAEYDQLDPKFKEAGIKIQQIMLKVARQDLDAQVEQKAKDLIAKLRDAKGDATEQAFAEAAKGYSEDPATARNGGFLTAPFKKNPNKPHGLYDRAVDMHVGEVFDIPIRYNNNWYILRRGDSVPKTFEQAKQEILVSLRNRRGYGIAFQLAQKVHNRLKETKDPQKVAQEFAAEANMAPADMVRETAYIKPGDDVPNVGVNQQFEGSLVPLNNPNDVGEVTGIKDGFAVPMLLDKKEPRIPEFDEVKTKVADALKQQRAKEQIEQKAKDLIASLSGPGDLKAAGEREGFDSGLEEGFKRESTLGKAGASDILDDAIYNLKEGEITKTPIRLDDKWVILGLVKRENANMATFNSERDRIKMTMLRDRQAQVFEDYITAVQERMKRESKIKIYDDVLKRLDEAEPAAQPLPGLPGGLNFPGEG